ncbi:hypothetical protein HY745_09140, partial [Candidatus Desantisbacteria bacterium]|nr:hypothetical protein [Candidatus Desantisbacteria bacterium]
MAKNILRIFCFFILFVFALSCSGGSGGGSKKSSQDTTLPQITSTSPANNAIDVAI